MNADLRWFPSPEVVLGAIFSDVTHAAVLLMCRSGFEMSAMLSDLLGAEASVRWAETQIPIL